MALIIVLRDAALLSLKADYLIHKLQLEAQPSYLKLCTYAQVVICSLECDVHFGLESCIYNHAEHASVEGES